MKPINKFSMTLAGHPTNESFICRVISDFIMPLEPIGEDLSNFIAAIKKVFTNCVNVPNIILRAVREQGLGWEIENCLMKRICEALYDEI